VKSPGKVLQQTQAEIERSRKLRKQAEQLISKVAKTIEADKRALQRAKNLRRTA
jgi:hypothetical protein